MDGHVYHFERKNKSNNEKIYRCQKRKTHKCPGKIIINPKGEVAGKNTHTCSGKTEPIERF